MVVQKKSNKPVWQPQVEDTSGAVRRRFNDLRKRTGICKKILASRIFDIGIRKMEEEAAIITRSKQPNQ